MKWGNVGKKILGLFTGSIPVLDLIVQMLPSMHGRVEKIEKLLGIATHDLDELRATRAEIKAAIADPDTGPHLVSLLTRLDKSLDKIPIL